MATSLTAFLLTYTARQPPPGYQAWWLLSELQRIQQALPRTASRAIDGNSPAKDLIILPTDVFLLVDATVGDDIHLLLPNPVTSEGLRVTIKKTDPSGNNVILDGYLVDGIPHWTLALQYQSVTVVAGQGVWWQIAQT